MESAERSIRIGWGSTDLTPPSPVLLAGQFYARVSEGVRDPITATALALESVEKGSPSDQAVMISCDLVAISDELRDAVKERLRGIVGLDSAKVFMNATHTHTAPEVRSDSPTAADLPPHSGVVLDVMNPADYVRFAADRIAVAAAEAWRRRAPGGISWGLGHAVIGHNRRWADLDGVSTMYGNTNDPRFSHIEGYEDHAVNLLFTWDHDLRLTGIVVNLACPSQATETDFQISADFWHETRVELRRRFGDHLFIMPQCSPAGDQSPHHIFRKAAERQMCDLKGRTEREEIAVRIADAVQSVLPWMDRCIERSPLMVHRVETLYLPRRMVTEMDVQEALAEANAWRKKYEAAIEELKANPELRRKPRWYVNVTQAYRRAVWYEGVATRYELQKREPTLPVEVHVVRLGDVVFATNPFEYYLDFGIRIHARSRAVQNFLVQLAGNGTYVPTRRAVAGRSYGAVPASTLVGPEGGAELAERTISMINQLWGA